MKTNSEDGKLKNRREGELIETDKKIKQMVRDEKTCLDHHHQSFISI